MSPTYTHWTTHEMKRLRECYSGMTRAELAIEFAPHPISSILFMARSLKLRKRRRWMTICSLHKPVIFGERRP